MMFKLPVIGFALVTALSGTALAHEPNHNHGGPAGYRPAAHGPAGHGEHGRGGHGWNGSGGGYGQTASVDLRYADLNRDGYVSLQEALDSGRQVFHRNDRNNDRLLSRREVSFGNVAQDDQNRDGRLSMREHQRSIRAEFASHDRNRDGYLARYELGMQGPRAPRSAGWWR
jgi:hypothetical protein